VKRLSYDEHDSDDDMIGEGEDDLCSDQESMPKYHHSISRILGLGQYKKMHKQYWTKEEDEKLQTLVDKHGAKNWKRIASYFDNRTDVQCLHRWQKVLNPELVKGPWTTEEDHKVVEMVRKYGAKNWSAIASYLPGRIGKQ
jgi:hypothetical protein